MGEFDYLEFDSWKAQNPVRPQTEETASKLGPFDHGRLCRHRGDFFEAARWFRSESDANEHHYAARVLEVDSLVRSDAFEEADIRSAAHIAAYARVREHYACRALALAHMNNFAEAERHCDIALDGNTASPYSRCVKGELILLGDPRSHAKAISWFERAADLADDRWEPHAMAGQALLRADLPSLAAGFFAEAGHADPGASYSWIGLGDCFAQLRLYDQALFYYRRVLQAEPGNAMALDREKKYGGGVFGLMRAFHKPSLVRRWNAAYDKLMRKGN